MSSTTNIQNYLSNVFRPAYTYNSLTSQFQASLNMSNINDLTVNSLAASQFNIGDINGNVYVGSNAGNTSDTLRDAFRNVAVGATAGFSVSNVRDSVFLGYASGLNTADASSIIAIGKGTITGGSETIYIGTDTGNVLGSNNIFIGHGLSASGNVSDRIFIGVNSSGQTVFNADLSENRVGILTSTPRYNIDLDGYTYVQDGLGINADPREHTLNVNGDMFVEDGYGFMTFDHDEVTSNSFFTIGSYTPGKKMIMTVSGDLFITGFLNISAGTSQTEVIGQSITALDFLNAGGAISTLGTTTISGLLTTTSGAVFSVLDVSGLTVRGANMDASQTNAVFSNVGARGTLNVSGASFFGGNSIFTSSTINASTSTLFVNNLNASGSLNVSGASFFGSNLTVANTATANTLNASSTLNSFGTMNVSGRSFFSSPVTMNTSLSVSNKSFFYNDLEVSGNLIIRGNTVTNTDATYRNIVANGTLNVSDSTFLRSGLFVRGALSMSGGGLINASASTMDVNSLLVRNGLSASGAVTLNTLTVSGPAVFNNAGTFATLESTGIFTVGGTSTLSNTGVRGTLNVCGTSQFASLLTASGILVSSNLGVRGALNVSGASALYNTLSVTGDARFSNALICASETFALGRDYGTLGSGGVTYFISKPDPSNLTGRSSILSIETVSNLSRFQALSIDSYQNALFESNVGIKGTLNVSGASSFYNSLNVTSNVGIQGTLNVSGNTAFANNAIVTGSGSFLGNLNVSGTTRMFSNLVLSNAGLQTNARFILGPAPSLTNNDYCSLIQSTQNTAANGGSELSFWTHGAALNFGDPTRALTIASNQNATFSSNVSVLGLLTVSGSMNVSGISTFTSNIVVTGSAGVSGNLNVSGISRFTSNIVVSGSAAVSGSMNVSGSLFALGPLRGPKNYMRYQFFNPQQDVTTSTAYYPNFASNARISSSASPSTIVNLTFTLSPASGEQDIRTFDTIALYVYGLYIDGLSVVIGPRADNIASLTKRSDLIDLGNPSGSTYGGYTATRDWSTLSGSPPSTYIVVGHNETQYYSTNSLMFLLQSNFDYNSATASLTFPIADGRNGVGGTVFTYLGTPVIFRAVPLYC